MSEWPTDRETPMPVALERAWALLEHPPARPDTARGYLDLIGPEPDAPPNAIQSLWSSTLGSTLYDHAQSMLRRLLAAARPPESALRLPPGGRALDIGCGPGQLTGPLGRAAGPEGLALGVDVSEPMLERAVRAAASENVGFIRADARELPFHEASFDVVISVAAIQLIPEPKTVLAQMGRVLAPGGHVAIMVPTPRDHLLHRVDRLIGNRSGLEYFDPDQLADWLHAGGFTNVHTRQWGTILWTIAS